MSKKLPTKVGVTTIGIIFKKRKSLKVSYHKRKLPHFQIDGYSNFITFRTYDSIDSFVKKINNSSIETKLKQYKIDKYLDSSSNGAYFLDDKIINTMKNILHSFDSLDYTLIAYSIMPNHIHLIINPKSDLSNIMKKIKGISAREINLLLKRDGKFWAKEYYDKVIKDEKQMINTIEYVLNNPIKAGLKDSSKRVYCKY